MKKACVIGDPISHSLSPRVHGFWLDQYKIEGSYTAQKVEASELEPFIRSLESEGYEGCNVTIPHKEKVFELVDILTPTAKRMKAVNTIVVQEDGSLLGDNTDGYGFVANLEQHVDNLSDYLSKVVILGAGGAARAIAFALSDLGAKLVITNRSIEKAEDLASKIDVAEVVRWEEKEQALSHASMVVNTTSLGMLGKDALEMSLEYLPQDALVTDIVYNPLMTTLLEQTQSKGNKVVTGIGMLLHQAVPGFEAWFGTRPQVSDVLERHVLDS